MPAFAQDTFVTVTDVVGGTYQLPLANCPTQGLTYTRSTNSFACVSGSSAPAGGSSTQVQFNDSGVLGGDAGFTYVKATDTASLGALVLTTPLPATSGGTGFASYAVGDLPYASTTTALAKLADVAAGSYLRSGGVTTPPVWSTATLPNTATAGDVLYASASNVYANLASVAAGSYMRSGGVTTAPVWSTATLPNTATAGDVLYASATNVYSNRAAVATGQVLTSAGASTAPVWSGAPLLTAGTGTQTYHLPGALYWENGAVAVGADTNYVSTSAYSLPAGTMATNGDRLFIEAEYLINATAGTKTYRINLGFTSFANDGTGYTGGTEPVAYTTAGTSISLHCVALVTRTAATTGNYLGACQTSGNSWQQTIYTVGGAWTWANALNIGSDAKSSAASASNIIIEEFRVTYLPR